MRMNEDNNEAGVWGCESNDVCALFNVECRSDAKCCWCTMKEEQSLSPQVQQEYEVYLAEKKAKQEAEVEAANNAYLADGIARLNEMKHHGLDAHNKSIDLCIAAFTDIFNTDADDQSQVREDGHSADVSDFPGFSEEQQVRPCCEELPTMWSMTNIWAYNETSEYEQKRGKKSLSIEFRGKESGIKYKITITYKHIRANKLANKIDEIVQANSLYPISDSVLRGFIEASDFLSFQVHREDADGGWDYLCIDPSGDFGVWPGDDVATLIMCLYDDLNTALDPAMYTLRHGMQDASKIAFLNGNSKSSIHRLTAYEAAFERIAKASKNMKRVDVLSLSSKLKSDFSDPEYARDSPRTGVDYEMLQDEAWEAEWNEHLVEGEGFQGLGDLFG